MLAVSGGDNKVTLWKESLAGGDWTCISDNSKNSSSQQGSQNQQQPGQQQQQQPVQG